MDVLKFECPDYLITVSTASVNYAWDRFVRRVRSAAQTYCAYSSSRKGTLKLRDLPAGKNELVAQNDEIVPCEEWPQLWPVLFETCKYQFAVEFKQGLDISIEKQYPHVRHQLKSIGENFKFYSSSSDSGILVGDIDFLNSPGKLIIGIQTDFCIMRSWSCMWHHLSWIPKTTCSRLWLSSTRSMRTIYTII